MTFQEILGELGSLELKGLYERDVLSHRGLTDQELAGVFAAADALRVLRETNYHLAVFRSGLALWEGAPEDRGFAPFAAGCAMMGLQVFCVKELERSVLVRGMPDVISAGDRSRGQALGALSTVLYREKGVHQRPLVLCPEEGLGMVLHILHRHGGAGEMRGKETALPQGAGPELLDLAARFGLTPGPEAMGEADLCQAEGLEPYVTAAMILLGKCHQPVEALERLRQRAEARRLA